MIKKLKRIVVGIDIFSKSNIALERALMIAKNNNSELYIVHIVETPWLSLPSYFGGEEIMIDTQILKKKITTKRLLDYKWCLCPKMVRTLFPWPNLQSKWKSTI